MRVDTSLYGDDAVRFEELRERCGDAMPGSEPSRPELVRMMMDVFEEEELPNGRLC